MFVVKDNVIMRKKFLRSYLRADGGVAAIEAAFILPFLVVLFFGLLDITEMISYNRRVTAAASSVGDLVGQNRVYVTETAITDYFKAATLIMKPKSDASLRVVVHGFRKTGSTVTKEWTVDNGKGAACSTTPTPTTVPVNLMTAGNDLIITQACMQYKPLVGNALGNSIIGGSMFKLEQTIVLRPRSSLTLDCYETSPTSAKC